VTSVTVAILQRDRLVQRSADDQITNIVALLLLATLAHLF
jgi:hypothetical protein